MTDQECVRFLQRVLPRLGLRWPGFRKVRGQIHKRLNRRLEELDLTDLAAYEMYLKAHPTEWSVLDSLCRISISRFCRDRRVFHFLGEQVLPEIAGIAADPGREARVWSAGCASGEEPYTLAMIWKMLVQPGYPQARLRLIATDADEQLLDRARRATYPASSLREIPEGWRQVFFSPAGDEFRFRTESVPPVEFRRQDIRAETPDGPFSLVLCRNLVFTYFSDALQRQVLERILERMPAGGFLAVGTHERPPVRTGEGVALHGHPEILRIGQGLDS